MESFERYVQHRIPPGDFLMAILENNFQKACGCADDENLRNLPAYAAFVHNELPYACHGSLADVYTWLRGDDAPL